MRETTYGHISIGTFRTPTNRYHNIGSAFRSGQAPIICCQWDFKCTSIAFSVAAASIFFFTTTSAAESADTVGIQRNTVSAAWYNEPTYINPGTEGLSVGITPIDYDETGGNRFLGQYVCIDSENRPVPADPYLCTSSRRKLKIGEDLPYIRYSKTTSGKLATVSNSLPLAFQDRVRFLNTHHSGSISRIVRNYTTGDGYDVTDSYNGYNFIYGTRDPVTTAEDFIWCGEFGALGGGWMLWPDNIGASNGSGLFSIGGGSYGTCSPRASTYTIWEAPKWIRYTNSKSLYTIKTLHFSTSTVAASEALEVFYQNTLYGGIRWEAWKSTLQTDSGAAECNGESTMVVEGKRFYRKYCHEWTNLQFQTTPYHAYHNPLNVIFTTSPQKLKNSDFVNGTQYWTLQSSPPGGITYAPATETSGNPYLIVNKIGGSSVVSVSQAFTGLGVAAYADPVLQGGVLLKGPIGAEGVVGIILSSSRAPLEERKIRFSFKNSEWTVIRFHAESVHLSDSNVKMTLKFYPKAVGAYAMDEVFLAVLPKTLQ
jgi:hypothetical protein